MLAAFVASVEQEFAALLRSLHAGWHGPKEVADPHVPIT
jgi:hypothetical protein